MKLVSARNNSIAAGGNVIILITPSESSKAIDIDALIKTLSENLNRPEGEIRDLLTATPPNTQNIQHLLDVILMQSSLATTSGQLYEELIAAAAELEMDIPTYKSLLELASASIRQRLYADAYHHFQTLLTKYNIFIPPEHRPKVISDYLQSGFLAFANSGDRDRLIKLAEEARKMQDGSPTP